MLKKCEVINPNNTSFFFCKSASCNLHVYTLVTHVFNVHQHEQRSLCLSLSIWENYCNKTETSLAFFELELIAAVIKEERERDANCSISLSFVWIPNRYTKMRAFCSNSHVNFFVTLLEQRKKGPYRSHKNSFSLEMRELYIQVPAFCIVNIYRISLLKIYDVFSS